MSRESGSSSPPHPWVFGHQKLEGEIQELKDQMTRLTQILSNFVVTQNQHPHQNRTTTPPAIPQPPPQRHLRQPPPLVHYGEELIIDSDSSEGERFKAHRRNLDDDQGLKIDIPEFEGSLSPDDFMDWLHAIERVFDYKGYSEENKCKVAILKFKDYASLWWEILRK